MNTDEASTYIEMNMYAPDGAHLVQAPFHKAWQTLFSREGNTLIRSPRAHGKSTQLIGRIAGELRKKPNLRVRFVANNPTEANASAGYIKTLLGTDNAPSLVSAGIFADFDGLDRIDLLVLDDPVDYANYTDNKRQQEMLWRLRLSLLPCLSATARVWWTQTLATEEDACTILEKDGLFAQTWKSGAEIVAPLWPEYWSMEKLAKRKSLIGEETYAKQYLLK